MLKIKISLKRVTVLLAIGTIFLAVFIVAFFIIITRHYVGQDIYGNRIINTQLDQLYPLITILYCSPFKYHLLEHTIGYQNRICQKKCQTGSAPIYKRFHRDGDSFFYLKAPCYCKSEWKVQEKNEEATIYQCI